MIGLGIATRGGGSGGTTGQVNSSNLFLDGQETSFATGDIAAWERGIDHDTMAHNNGYGLASDRFTDDTGAQTYTANIVIDWSTWDVLNSTVLGFYRVTATSTNWLNAMSLAVASTQAGYTDWTIPSRKEIANLYNEEVSGGSPIGLNFSPMNIIVSASSERLWMRTTGGITTRVYSIIENGGYQGLNKTTTTNDFFLVRQFAFSEISL